MESRAAPSRRKVVVVTGASAGIGRAIAREFAAHGAHLCLLARGEDGLEGARREVEALGSKCLTHQVDVSDEVAVDAAAEACERTLGPIDTWVNNAMVSILAPLKEVTPAEFRRVTEVTYLGYVWGTMAALKRMLPRNRGAIVQVSSALAHRSIPLQSAYCGAKHAIAGFTESVRCELLHDKSAVSISTVELPGVNTPQFQWIRNRMPNKSQPVGAIFQPEVAARAVVWISQSRRRDLQVGLPTVEAILGEKVSPALLDRYLASTVYSGHQTNEPDDPYRADNLWEPVPGDHGAHGPFDDRSKNHSVQAWASMHRRWLTLAGVGLGVALTLGLAGSRGNHSGR